jgi:PKD repeat protein
VSLIVNDGTVDSAPATTTVEVTAAPNSAPIADANGPYTAIVNAAVTLDGSASSDADGDTLAYSWDFGDTTTGSGAMPSHTYTAIGTYTVSLIVNDGTVDSAPATTTVEVTAPPNSAPVAVEDSATTSRNISIDIDLTANDSDVDGNLKIPAFIGDVAAGQITITTGGTTARGGTVTTITNGVTYTPRRNFRGIDTFSYTVTDLDGSVSNEVIVTVNVVL